MEPARASTDRSRPRSRMLVPSVLLLSVAAPIALLAARSPGVAEPARAAAVGSAAPSVSGSPSVRPTVSGSISATPVVPSPTAPPTASPTASPTPAGPVGRTTTSAFSLEPGDCLPVEPPETASVTVVVLPCTQPHEAEVFAVFQLPGSPEDVFPGEAVATAQSVEGCELRFSDYVGIAYGASSFDYFFYKPDAQTWSALNDRTVTCLLTSEPRSLSAKDSAL